MYILGAIILVCVVGWYSFSAIDSIGLQNQSGTGTVIAKEHREARQTYTTDIIGGQARTVARTMPEMYALRLDISGHETTATVDRDLYNSVSPHDEVRITYQRRRITGSLQVVHVAR
jgi:hypothetical protein